MIRNGQGDTEETVTYVRTTARQNQPETHQSHFGDYELLEEIARGGMGVVYKARQISLNRIVALKMMKSGELAGEEEIKRFQAEAEAAAKIDHPNIVPVYEVGQTNGLQFFSMGFVQGKSLAERLKQGPLPPLEAAALMHTVALAVQFAHDKGVIHRDLKPANVLTDAEGNPRITDFGLAKQTQGDSNMTATGQVMGTPSFMPPEQAAGKTDEIGPLVDVYSIGAMLYALITGRPPFQAASVIETLQQVCEREPVSPRQVNPAVDRDLETICLKCLEKEPSKRYASAKSVAEDLANYLQGLPIAARPIGLVTRIARWCGRNIVVATLIAVSLFLLVAGSLFSTIFGLQANQRAVDLARTQGDLVKERDNAIELSRKNLSLANQKQELADKNGALARSNKTLADQYKETAEQERRARSQTAAQRYIAVIQVAWAAWKQGNIGRMKQLLATLKPVEGEKDYRGWEWRYLSRLCNRNLLSIDAHSGPIHAIAMNPDETKIASVGQDGKLRVWNLTTGELAWEAEAHETALAVTWSSHSEQIITGGTDGVIKIWDESTGKVDQVVSVDADQVRCLACSPDGRTCAVILHSKSSAEARLRIVNVDTYKTVFERSIGTTTSVAWSPDGSKLAWHIGWHVYALETATGKVIFDEQAGRRIFEWAIASVQWEPTGTRIAASTIDGQVLVYGIDTPDKPLAFKGHQSDVHAIAWSPDGEKIASAGYDQIIRIWDAETGSTIRTIRGHSQGVTSLIWTAGNKLVSTGREGRVFVWDPLTPQDAKIVSPPDAALRSFPIDVFWSPDAKNVVVNCISGGGASIDVHTLAFSPINSHAPGPFQPNGELALSYEQQFQHPSVCRALNGKVVRKLEKTSSSFAARFVWSPSGKLIAGAANDACIWNAETGQIVTTCKSRGRVVQVVWNADGTKLASADLYGVISVWNVKSGEKLKSWQAHDRYIASLDWQGSSLASASWDHSIKIWNAETGKLQKQLNGHTGPVSIAAWSPDGRRLASGSGQWFFFPQPGQPTMWLEDSDRDVKIWDVDAGIEVLSLEGHESYVTDVAWSPDGKQLASVGRDMSVRIWQTETE